MGPLSLLIPPYMCMFGSACCACVLNGYTEEISLERSHQFGQHYYDVYGQHESKVLNMTKLLVAISGHFIFYIIISNTSCILFLQRVNIVLSVTEGSSLCGTLSKRKGIAVIPLGRLEPSERAELVRGKLAVYGKKLEESAFNNQVRCWCAHPWTVNM